MDLVTGSLILLGGGFLVANARLALEYLRYLRLQRGALLKQLIDQGRAALID